MTSEPRQSVLLSFCLGRLQAGMAIVGLMGALTVARVLLFTAMFGAVASRGRSQSWAADLVWLVPLALIGAIIWRLLQLSKGDRAALRETPEGLEARGFFQQRTIAWPDLLGAHEVVYGFGLHTRRLLNIRYLHQGANRTIRVPLVLTQRSKGGARALSEAVDAARARALGYGHVAGIPAVHEGQGVMDPDAAIARYLARKQAQNETSGAPEAVPASAAAPVGPPRRAFGRKGISPSAPA